MNEQGFRAPEAQRISGITYRQLDYWARTGLVMPSVRGAHGSGSQRLYSFQDLMTLRIVKSLLDAGMTLQKVRTAVEHLRATGKPLHSITVMTDGDRIYEADSPESVVDLLRGGQGVFAISLDRVWSDLEDTVRTIVPDDEASASRARHPAAAGRS
jgi:DNA-binding transcriptional MerR regulator